MSCADCRCVDVVGSRTSRRDRVTAVGDRVSRCADIKQRVSRGWLRRTAALAKHQPVAPSHLSVSQERISQMCNLQLGVK